MKVDSKTTNQKEKANGSLKMETFSQETMNKKQKNTQKERDHQSQKKVNHHLNQNSLLNGTLTQILLRLLIKSTVSSNELDL